jgi:hypothetical protein
MMGAETKVGLKGVEQRETTTSLAEIKVDGKLAPLDSKE